MYQVLIKLALNKRNQTSCPSTHSVYRACNIMSFVNAAKLVNCAREDGVNSSRSSSRFWAAPQSSRLIGPVPKDRGWRRRVLISKDRRLFTWWGHPSDLIQFFPSEFRIIPSHRLWVATRKIFLIEQSLWIEDDFRVGRVIFGWSRIFYSIDRNTRTILIIWSLENVCLSLWIFKAEKLFPFPKL